MRWPGGLGLAVAALVCAGCAGAGESSPADAAKPSKQLEPMEASAQPAAPAPAKKQKWTVPRAPAHGPAYLVAEIRKPLHTPFGIVAPQSQFGQPVWVPVVHRRADRGRLLVPLGNRGRLVAEDLKSFRLQWRKVRVVVDLSADRMVVRDGRRKLGTFPVGKGSPSTPTPTGRFFVTDRLRFGQGSPKPRSLSASRRTCRSCRRRGWAAIRSRSTSVRWGRSATAASTRSSTRSGCSSAGPRSEAWW